MNNLFFYTKQVFKKGTLNPVLVDKTNSWMNPFYPSYINLGFFLLTKKKFKDS
jgi:hypothetical protein